MMLVNSKSAITTTKAGKMRMMWDSVRDWSMALTVKETLKTPKSGASAQEVENLR